MTAEALGDLLARVNAALNFTSLVLLLAGYGAIRRNNPTAHRRAMAAAVAASALFLIFYLLRFSVTGTHRFAGEGVAKVVYYAILFSHMILAAAIVPLVLRVLFLALRSRFQEHRRWARWTLPLWIYVSATGLLVYFLLYHVYGYL